MRAQYCNVIHVTTPLTACIQSTLSIQISNQIREKALFFFFFLWKNWNKTKPAVRNKIIAVSTGTVYVLTVSCQRGPQTPVYNRILIRLTRIYESSICVCFFHFLLRFIPISLFNHWNLIQLPTAAGSIIPPSENSFVPQTECYSFFLLLYLNSWGLKELWL